MADSTATVIAVMDDPINVAHRVCQFYLDLLVSQSTKLRYPDLSVFAHNKI